MNDNKKLIDKMNLLIKESKIKDPMDFSEATAILTEIKEILEQQDEVRKYICKVCGSEWLIEKDEMELCPEPPKVPDDLVEEIYSLFDGENEDMIKETAHAIFSQPVGKIGETVEKARKEKIRKLLQRQLEKIRITEEEIEAHSRYLFKKYSPSDIHGATFERGNWLKSKGVEVAEK